MFDYTEKNKQKQKEEASQKAPKFTDSDNSIYIDQNLQKLYEVAIEKAVRHEELTEEEEHVIIGIPEQLRKKGKSYEDSYSFANFGEKLLLNDYRKLNDIGQSEARKRVSELTEIPRYTKPDEPTHE